MALEWWLKFFLTPKHGQLLYKILVLELGLWQNLEYLWKLLICGSICTSAIFGKQRGISSRVTKYPDRLNYLFDTSCLKISLFTEVSLFDKWEIYSYPSWGFVAFPLLENSCSFLLVGRCHVICVVKMESCCSRVNALLLWLG